MRLTKMAAKHFEYMVIGGGSGGIAGARRAAEFGVKVALVENKPLGGTCVNVGCVPKKIMFYASEMASQLHSFKEYGFEVQLKGFNWQLLKSSRDAYIRKLNGIYADNLAKSKVQLVHGLAKFSKEQDGGGEGGVVRLEVEGQTYTADHVLIATGGKPIVLEDIPGHDLGVTSDGFFEMSSLPKKVVLVGAGYIAVELAGILRALGSDVSLVIRGSKVLRNFDSMISDVTTQNLEASGVTLYKDSQVVKVELQSNSNTNNSSTTSTTTNTSNTLRVHMQNGEVLHDVDKLIWAVGRVPNTQIGLEHVGVQLDSRGNIQVDEYQRTTARSVYAVGDVCGKQLLTPVAIAAGRRLSHRLFNGETDNKLDYNNIPSVIFSHPPSGSIGLSQAQAEETHGVNNIRVYKSSFVPLHDSLLQEKSKCHYKLICLLPSEKIIGLHLVGNSSDEILQGFSVAIKMGACKKDFDDTVAIHPTSAEELVTMR